MHVHGAVNLEPATRASTPAAASESALEQRLGDPYKVTALPLSDIGVMREAGGARPQVVCVVSPPNLSFHFISFHFISFYFISSPGSCFYRAKPLLVYRA